MARKSIFIILFIILAKTILSQGWQWQNPKPLGDPIHQVLFIDNQVGWMAPENSTLLKTTNGGSTWTTVYTNIYFDRLYFIDRNEGWAVGRKHYVPEYINSVYHTTDGGLSWEVQFADTLSNNVSNIFFVNKEHGWIGGGLSNIYQTTNGGKHWESKDLQDYPFLREVYSVLFVDTLKGWAVGDSPYGLKTTDGGNSWSRDSSLGYVGELIALDSLNIWALNSSWIIKTTNSGISWELMKKNQPDERNTDLFIKDTSRIFLSTNQAFYESTDGGKTWPKNSDEDLNGFSVINGNEVWGGGAMNTLSSKIVYSTDNGHSWTDIVTVNNPLGYTSYGDVDFVDKNTGWIITELDSSVLKTTNGGESWSEQNIDTDQWLRKIFMIDNQTGYIVGNSGIIFKTTNGGTDWLPQNSGTNYELASISFINERNGWVAGTTVDDYTGVLLRTTNGGENWDKVSINGAAAPTSVCFIDSLQGWVTAGKNSYNDLGRIYKTIDGGETWTELTGGASVNFRNILFVDSTEGFSFWYNGPAGLAEIYSTKDGGENWHIKGFKNTVFGRIKFINKNNGWLVGSFGRIYGTTDGGDSWKEQLSGFTSRELYGIDFIDPNNGWTVGWYGTILHTTNGGVTFVDSKKNNKETPTNFQLYQNYPNPFNPSTTIQYQIPATGFVTLKIYDVLGREIVTLVNKEQTTGRYEVSFNASNLSSGVYFYSLSVTSSNKINNIQVRKMVLIK